MLTDLDFASRRVDFWQRHAPKHRVFDGLVVVAQGLQYWVPEPAATKPE